MCKKTVKHGGGNVMVWGCFVPVGIGDLVFIKNIMYGDHYRFILKNNLTEPASSLGFLSVFPFQHGQDPKHTLVKGTNFECSYLAGQLNPQI